MSCTLGAANLQRMTQGNAMRSRDAGQYVPARLPASLQTVECDRTQPIPSGGCINCINNIFWGCCRITPGKDIRVYRVYVHEHMEVQWSASARALEVCCFVASALGYRAGSHGQDPTHGCVGKAVAPRRLGVMPRTIAKSRLNRATHYARCIPATYMCIERERERDMDTVVICIKTYYRMYVCIYIYIYTYIVHVMYLFK